MIIILKILIFQKVLICSVEGRLFAEYVVYISQLPSMVANCHLHSDFIILVENWRK
jgi:hypothetical protein